MSAQQIQYTGSGYDSNFVHDPSTEFTGIGTGSPNQILEIRVDNPGGLGPKLLINNTSGGGGAGGAIQFNSTGSGSAPNGQIQASDNDDYSVNLVFSTKTPGSPGNPLAERMRISSNGNVGIGTTSPAAELNVTGSTSFSATGTVSVTAGNTGVTGSGTSFTTQMVLGDRITVTISGVPSIRTVTAITGDTHLTVDAPYEATASGLTMTVMPPIFRADNSSGNPELISTGDGHVVIGTKATSGSPTLSGFLGLAGSEINDDDSSGYVVCNADVPFFNKNEEMRGYQSTMRYTRSTADDPEGWDVFAYGGAISLENMDFSSNPDINGQMKPFQSELYFTPKASGSLNYTVTGDAMNYAASLTQVDSSCTVTQWTGFVVESPCSGGGAANHVTTGYGLWVLNLDDGEHTLVAANAAAIKIDGLNEYGRILWNGSSIYETSSGDLEINATSLGFYGVSPIAQQTITGSKGGNAALGNLLTALANLGLIVDSTT